MPKILPKPGTETGPCQKNCGHIDCQEIRQKAKSICPICKKHIGYQRAYIEYEDRLFHLTCLY